MGWSEEYKVLPCISVTQTDIVGINETLRRVHVTTVAVAKQYVLHTLGVCP
jgi:hypothetical protein